tara:strand:- start:47 stop:526 length:480 start_codon:yes stop_codon:yes gene_type:complete
MYCQFILIVLFVLKATLAFSAKIYFNEMLSYEITTETTFSDKTKYQTFKVKGGVTFSTGVYAIKHCSGDRSMKEGNLINLKSICKVNISDGETIWTKVSGKDRYVAKGTGVFEIIDGTGNYTSLIGNKCNYALNIYNEIIFAKGVCEVEDDVYKNLIIQ